MKKKLLRLRSIAARAAVPGALVAGASSAHAEVDVSAVVTAMEALATPIGLIGGAVLVVYVGIKGYKYIRSAMA